MGHKGNSKRKPKQLKAPSGSNTIPNGAVSSFIQTSDDKRTKSFDPINSEPGKKGSEKGSSDGNKKSKKG